MRGIGWIGLGAVLVAAVSWGEGAPQHGPILTRALEGPLSAGAEVIFTARMKYDDPHWYANIGYYCEDETLKARAGNGGMDVGKLYKLDLRTGKLEILLDETGGTVRDPQLHYDGKKILFSLRKANSDYFHLYEIGTDGEGLRQLTFGEFDDIEPAYLPDGGLAFVSTRCKRWVNCWLTQVATLFRSDGDGRNIRQLSANVEHDNTPWMLPDGRLLYTRWEYVDRSQVEFHKLWTMNPDGTNQVTYFGNMHQGGLYIDAKPIPGTDSVLATLSPGHGRNEHMGYAGIISPKRGPDIDASVLNLNPKLVIRDPYPISNDFFLMAFQNKLILMDRSGNYETLYTLPGVDGLHEPRLVCARPRERILPDRMDPARAAGQMLLTNVYESRNLEGVAPGEIKKLLILESLPKQVNFSGGQDLLSWLGTFTLERVLGTVPVERDGSAFFELPANRPVIFVALDENDLSIKRMQSFTSLMPGEVQSCVGCHEQRTLSPANPGRNVVLAMQRAPSKIEPFDGLPDVIDFNRDVQPILDKNCTGCHNFGQHAGNLSLEGDLGPAWSHSYYALLANKQVTDGRNGLGNQPPRSIGSAASPLLEKLRGGHHDVAASEAEWRTVWMWIESGAPYVGSYAGLRSEEDASRSQGGIVFGGARDVLKRRCAECHDVDNSQNETGRALPFSPEIKANPRGLDRPTGMYERVVLDNDPLARFSQHILLNLSHPERSPLLRGPLAKRAGGWDSCGGVFESTEDPDYRSLLAAIQRCKERADAVPRYGTPEFRPNRQYIREMIKYGILPPGFDAAKDPIDFFAADQAYWKSFWYEPGAQSIWGPEAPEDVLAKQ